MIGIMTTRSDFFSPEHIVALSPRIRRMTAPNAGLMTGPGTNTYLVGNEKVAVIDVGCDVSSHVLAVEKVGADRIKWILVTHGHLDHSPGARELGRLTGAPVIGYGTSGHAPGHRFSPQLRVREGFRIEAEDWTLSAIHTPGHARDHLCYFLEPDGVLFSGDHVMQGSTVVIAPPDGDMAAYFASLERLHELPLCHIAPGHGDLISHPHAEITRIIAHRRAREAQIMRLLAESASMTIAELVGAIYAGSPPELHEWAALSVYAHLRKLRDEGRVSGHARRHRWRAVQ